MELFKNDEDDSGKTDLPDTDGRDHSEGDSNLSSDKHDKSFDDWSFHHLNGGVCSVEDEEDKEDDKVEGGDREEDDEDEDPMNLARSVAQILADNKDDGETIIEQREEAQCPVNYECRNRLTDVCVRFQETGQRPISWS